MNGAEKGLLFFGVVAVICFTALMGILVYNAHLGDILNTQRVIARDKLCSQIQDPASLTLCANKPLGGVGG